VIILFERDKPQSSQLSADVNAERKERGVWFAWIELGLRINRAAPYAIALQVHA